jgi:predicted metal-binding membrane protein
MDAILKTLARQDRAIVILSTAAFALLGWTYLSYQGWAMGHMDLVTMAMPSTGAWGPWDLLLVFAMWAVMMVAMMVPSVIPVLLTFATITRPERSFLPTL